MSCYCDFSSDLKIFQHLLCWLANKTAIFSNKGCSWLQLVFIPLCWEHFLNPVSLTHFASSVTDFCPS